MGSSEWLVRRGRGRQGPLSQRGRRWPREEERASGDERGEGGEGRGEEAGSLKPAGWREGLGGARSSLSLIHI